MTDAEKRKIDSMTFEGIGYRSIAGALGIPESTVKSYIRRNKSVKKDISRCLACGQAIDSGHHKKKFCCDACRTKWWNKHQEELLPFTDACAFCGKEIHMRRRGQKKYCCHRCYVNARFKGGEHNT